MYTPIPFYTKKSVNIEKKKTKAIRQYPARMTDGTDSIIIIVSCWTLYLYNKIVSGRNYRIDTNVVFVQFKKNFKWFYFKL